MIKRLLKPVMPALLVLGLLAPTAALCLPLQERKSCCPEPCSGHKAAEKNSPCCRPALPTRVEQRIFRTETAAFAAVPPSLMALDAPVSSIKPRTLLRPPETPPQDSSGLSPPSAA